ncbi:MAG TPA: hypothetical protein VHX88_10155 [Solirubrobacteraceae bacterium]|nr:hypothetical protein [Solirubrobacteraceae bacterium]
MGTLRPWPSRALELCQELAHAGSATIEYLAPLGRSSVRALLAAGSGGPLSSDAVERALRRGGR